MVSLSASKNKNQRDKGRAGFVEGCLALIAIFCWRHEKKVSISFIMPANVEKSLADT